MNWAMKSSWVIAYDLDVKGMRNADYTKSEVTQYYNKIKAVLTKHGFSKFSQLSIYGSSDENVLSSVYRVIDDFRKLEDKKFINRLNVFKVDTFSEMRPLIVEGPSTDIDPIEEKIEEMFEKETVDA